MRITIDNGDGLGAVEYTAVVAADGPLTVERELNKPSRCTATLVLGRGVTAPARRGRVVVTSDAGTVLFTGFLATEPVLLYAGAGTEGAVYRARVDAVSDDWLLDKQGVASNGSSATALAVGGTSVVRQLTVAAQSGVTASVTVSAGESARALGAFAVQPTAGWSTNAGAAANAVYASYRVVNGVVSVLPAGAVVHTLSDADGTLQPAAFSVRHLRELANDVTVSGDEEPAAYVQEVFQGDGTTTTFLLSETAFRGRDRLMVRDSFDGAVIDPTQWSVRDAGQYMKLTGAGLTVAGGSGQDGDTTLAGVNAVELGGAVTAELGGVVLGAGSDGMLSGFYLGSPVLASCFAGWRVRQSASVSGGNTVLVPVVNGAEVGTVYTPLAGHRYTLRLRLYCMETQRVPQRYYCMADGVVASFGGGAGVDAPVRLVFELVDEGVASNTPATVLFNSAASGVVLASSPANCNFVAVNATSLFGSVASVVVTRPGSVWVESTLPNGQRQTRLMGSAGQGVDVEVSYNVGGPRLLFFNGRIPAAGERVTVSFRGQRRAVARLADAASVAAETGAESGLNVPGVSRWLGKVESPAARSSADCEAAAAAILTMATARSAALSGRYTLQNPAADVWPGDVLEITSAGATTALLVRRVAVADEHALPESLRYEVSFANDWATVLADGMGLRLSDRVASDAVLPVQPASGPAEVLANLQQMNLVGLTGSALQVDAGLNAPQGGGFEVRRRDWAFGVGVDEQDLVLRSPVRSFSIPRAAQVERYFVRLYDGSTPPVYSRFSSAVFVNWPLS